MCEPSDFAVLLQIIGLTVVVFAAVGMGIGLASLIVRGWQIILDKSP